MKCTIRQLREIATQAMLEAHEPYDPNTKESIYGIYSDVYKEKYGVRPRWMRWQEMTIDQLQTELDRLYDEPGDVGGHEDVAGIEGESMEDLEDDADFTLSVEPMGMRHRARTRLHGPNPTKK